MATAETLSHERHRTAEYVAGGSSAEALGGVGAVVLAILGLLGVLPLTLAAIGTVTIGAALFIRGGVVAARYAQLRRETHATTRVDTAELGGGMTTEVLGGLAGIALGILGLIGVDTMTLLAVAIVVFGGTLLVGSGLTSKIDELSLRGSGADDALQDVARESVRAAAGTQVLVGVGALALGILAILGVDALNLVLIGLIAVGGAELLTGSALGARMASMLS